LLAAQIETGIKQDGIKNLYAPIIRQAVEDWKLACKKNDSIRKSEIKRFFESEWAKHILRVINLDFKIINNSLYITEE